MQDSNNFEHYDRGGASANMPPAPAAETVQVRRDAEGYVQPIMLLVDKTNPASHIDAVHAAALASVLAFAGESLSHEDPDPSWAAWLSGPFTKSVRRADAKTFEKLALKFADEEHADIHIGKARAMRFPAHHLRGNVPAPVQAAGLRNGPSRTGHRPPGDRTRGLPGAGHQREPQDELGQVRCPRRARHVCLVPVPGHRRRAAPGMTPGASSG